MAREQASATDASRSSMRSAQARASSARITCSPTPVTLHATAGLHKSSHTRHEAPLYWDLPGIKIGTQLRPEDALRRPGTHWPIPRTRSASIKQRKTGHFLGFGTRWDALETWFLRRQDARVKSLFMIPGIYPPARQRSRYRSRLRKPIHRSTLIACRTTRPALHTADSICWRVVSAAQCHHLERGRHLPCTASALAAQHPAPYMAASPTRPLIFMAMPPDETPAATAPAPPGMCR